MVQWLYGKNPNFINSVGRKKSNVFIEAVSSGSLEVVQWLYEKKPCFIDSVDETGENAFLVATQRSHFKVMKWLYEKNPNFINSISKYEKNAYTYVNNYSQDERVKIKYWLLERKPDLFYSKDARLEFPDISIPLLLLAHGIKGFLSANAYELKKCLESLELESKNKFNLLYDYVDNFGRSLVGIEINQSVMLSNMPAELQLYITNIATSSLVSESEFPKITSALLKDVKALEILKQRCAKEILLEGYPRFIKEHSPKIDYMEELRKAVIQNHIQKTSRFMATTAVKAYNDDAKPQGTFTEKIISWTSFALEQIINWVKGKPCEEYNKRQMRIKIEEMTNLISPILGTRLEKFDDYVFPELRAELMKAMYKTLVRLVNKSNDKVRHAIIEGVNKVIDTIPQSYVEKYAIRSEGEQIKIS